MTITITPEIVDPDIISSSVVGLTIELMAVGETEPHRHRKAQLLYVICGALTVEAAGGIWTVPPQCAVWLPAGVMHLARASGRIVMANLYIEPDLACFLGDDCGILFIRPLLREVILCFASDPAFMIEDDGRRSRLSGVLLDELRDAPLEPLRLPMPTDRRLRRLSDALLEDPSARFTIEEWGARIGASKRTLTRLFQRETGMSYGQWRQQLHVGLALQRLASGDAVTTIAVDLGYESASSFITMFRRHTGASPARYFGEGRFGASSPELRSRYLAARDEKSLFSHDVAG
ncbi:helix-turn-helix domain-containing protein [Agrobacterium vitis]|uniref:AraC family transcriptional regulator n=1 Tax=Agrobacterium vitis TaxID=373 RepID=UPI0012E79E8C|nr:helix-turn-helix transcriptional regulator [Agrobacterium vitis]MVA12284.1 helix-turn-helix domain-containing protein [Agrobacterium vitis]